jgi:hypothetical protein
VTTFLKTEADILFRLIRDIQWEQLLGLSGSKLHGLMDHFVD